MPTPKSRRVLRLPQTIAKSGLGRDSVYRGGREGWFPKPVKLSERASGWFEDEIDAWLEKRAAERDAASPPAVAPTVPSAGDVSRRAQRPATRPVPVKKQQRTAVAA
jgi:prophage regulatory protein